jgi:hypothetical protein
LAEIQEVKALLVQQGIQPMIRSAVMQTRNIVDLEEFLVPLKEWHNRLSRVRITGAGKSWISQSITVSGTFLIVDGESGFMNKPIDLSTAEVLERRDNALLAVFKDGVSIELQEETESAKTA